MVADFRLALLSPRKCCSWAKADFVAGDLVMNAVVLRGEPELVVQPRMKHRPCVVARGADGFPVLEFPDGERAAMILCGNRPLAALALGGENGSESVDGQFWWKFGRCGGVHGLVTHVRQPMGSFTIFTMQRIGFIWFVRREWRELRLRQL